MTRRTSIRSVAVLGAGTMGAQIAAHFGNAGVPVLLLDVSLEAARGGLKRAAALKPDPFFTRRTATLVTPGSFDRNLEQIASADWVVEAVLEELDIKKALFERVDRARRPGAIVSSNTSGIPIGALAEGRSDDFRRHLLGTHFFNPPRYLHLLELIPTPDTDPAVLDHVAWFADHRLGKGTVVAKDAPGFIANRLGLFAIIRILRTLASGDYTIEEIDAMTGPALGRPKSATFRTMDIAGIDVLLRVADDLVARLSASESAEAFEVPPLVRALVNRKSLGEKTGEGFYKRSGSEILTLEPSTLTYRAKQPARVPSIENASSIEDVRERIRTLFRASDRTGTFIRETLGALLIYCAHVWPSLAHSMDDVDRAMRWGFGWEIGPFEIWDAIGITHVLEATRPATIPADAAAALADGRETFREDPHFDVSRELQILKAARDRLRIVRSNPGGSLVDLGDGVLAVEFHSKLNLIGQDTVQIINAGLKEAAEHFAALVIGTSAPNFSAGANLTLVLLEAQEGNWDEIDLMVRTFQRAVLGLRYSEVPVVAAPLGLTLGGGCEIALHVDRVQASAETYMGLVEVGVGLIPAGGGTTEMLARATRDPAGVTRPVLPCAQATFETIAFARLSSSAAHARELGYLRNEDSVTMNPNRVLADAKAVALERARAGYRQPIPEPIRVGGESVEAALGLGVHLAWRAGRISDHDALIGRTLAHVLSGGSLPHETSVSEAHLLDLEREAFLKLCGERKTLERIRHTLKTGKPLRN